MSISQLLFGAFGGDMGSLTILFVLMLPFWLVGYAIYALVQKIRGKTL